MICFNCGSQCSDGAKFCGVCGQQMGDAPVQTGAANPVVSEIPTGPAPGAPMPGAPMPGVSTPGAQPPKAPRKKLRMKPVIITAAILVVLVVAGLVVRMFAGREVTQLLQGKNYAPNYVAGLITDTFNGAADSMSAMADLYSGDFKAQGGYKVTAAIPNDYLEELFDFFTGDADYYSDELEMLGFLESTSLSFDTSVAMSSKSVEMMADAVWSIGKTDILSLNVVTDGDDAFLTVPELYSQPFGTELDFGGMNMQELLAMAMSYSYSTRYYSSVVEDMDMAELAAQIQALKPYVSDAVTAFVGELNVELQGSTSVPINGDKATFDTIYIDLTMEDIAAATAAALEIICASDDCLDILADIVKDATGEKIKASDIRDALEEVIDSAGDVDNDEQIAELYIFINSANMTSGFAVISEYTEICAAYAPGTGFEVSVIDLYGETEVIIYGDLKASGSALSGNVSVSYYDDYSDEEYIIENLMSFSDLSISEMEGMKMISGKFEVDVGSLVSKLDDEGVIRVGDMDTLLDGLSVTLAMDYSGSSSKIDIALENKKAKASLSMTVTSEIGKAKSVKLPSSKDAIIIDEDFEPDDLDIDELIDNVEAIGDTLRSKGYDFDYFIDNIVETLEYYS